MPRVLPVVLALVVTFLVGGAVRMEPHFAGDVTIARTVQAISPGTSWATTYTRTATSPVKWIVVVFALAVCYAFAGWPGALFFLVALGLEQMLGEPSKSLFMRPRPSPDLVRVVGTPSGYSFPSTFMTFHAIVLGSIWLLARGARPGIGRATALIAIPILIIVGWACRVVVGAHWPSDVVLTTLLCVMWLVLLYHVMRTIISPPSPP